jgi:hypothetical protein
MGYLPNAGQVTMESASTVARNMGKVAPPVKSGSGTAPEIGLFAGVRTQPKVEILNQCSLDARLQNAVFDAPRIAPSLLMSRVRMAENDQTGDPDSVANYVAAMSADLAVMARRHGLDTLGYLLEMAQLEAENITRYDGGEREQ